MAGSSRSAAGPAVLTLALVAGAAGGQRATTPDSGRGARDARASGRIVRVLRSDTLPVAGVPVVLHRVGRQTQGPLDTVRTGGQGAFSVRFAPESAATYLLSVRWAGIEYFSEPIASDPGHNTAGLVIVVADTASDAAVRLRQRTTLISAPDESRARIVLDWFALTNESGLTRVAPDTGTPVWGVPLPRDMEGASLAEARFSAFSPDAVTFRNDSLLIWAPISPGNRELLVEYRIPGDQDRASIPLGAGADTMHLLVEEPSAVVRAPDLEAAPSQQFDGRTFRRWVGTGRRGAAVEVSFAMPAFAPQQALLLLVVLALAAFLALALLLVRRRAAAPATPGGPAAIVDAIARLDLRYRGREAEVPDAEWRAFQAERARLKSQLAAALAALRRPS